MIEGNSGIGNSRCKSQVTEARGHSRGWGQDCKRDKTVQTDTHGKISKHRVRKYFVCCAN